MHERARELLAKLHLDINPRVTLNSRWASGSSRWSRWPRRCIIDADVIIMDEPTVLPERARDRRPLARSSASCKEHGVAIIYISHHLDETFAVADRITVLRDGRHVATQATAELT